MATLYPTPPITEPELVHCLLSTGTAVQVTQHLTRIVAWVDLPAVEPDLASERRIVGRLVMPDDVARELMKQLQRALARGHN